MVEKNEIVVSTHDLIPLIKDELDNGYKVRFTVSGNSMRPWIVDNRDQVLLTGVDTKRLKLGNIILFQNSNGKYILHRIYKKDNAGYRTIGDAFLTDDGLVLDSQIIGVVEKIYRKGKEIDCNSFLWRFIFSAWRRLLPFRKYLLNLYFLLIRVKHIAKKLTILFYQRREA